MPDTRPTKNSMVLTARASIPLLLIYSCLSCDPKSLNKQEVIDEYGPEVINYFYETAFHEDKGGGIKAATYRWKEDIRVSVHGDLLEYDSLYVEEALSEINALDIPISITLVSNQEESNVQLFFGNGKVLADLFMVDSITTVGIGVVEDDSGASNWAKIGIVNDAKIYTQTNKSFASLLRKTTVLEEITQTLGILGDSYTYYGSRFFEGANNVESLSNIDKKVLKFLYDKRVFRHHKISRKDFEERFSDVLYDRIHTEKFSALAGEYGLDRHDLDSLGRIIFYSEDNNIFIKFPRNVFLKLSGDSTEAHLEFCRAMTERLNAVTPYIQMDLEDMDMIWNQEPAINIAFVHSSEVSKEFIFAETRVGIRKMMLIYLTKGDIWLKFRDTKKDAITYERVMPFHNEMLTRSLFKVLGLNIRNKILIKSSPDSLEINKKYENYLRFLYDPRFPSGISKVEFEELVKEIN